MQRATTRRAIEMSRFTYLYILKSDAQPGHYYIGRTADLRARLRQHNAGHVRYTAKWRPWHIKIYLALSDEKRAKALEQYPKSASDRAFVKKRL
jgi:putative endonuclease